MCVWWQYRWGHDDTTLCLFARHVLWCRHQSCDIQKELVVSSEMCGPKWLIDELYSHNAVIHHSYTLEDNIIHHSYFSSFIFLFLRIVQIGSHNAVIHHSYTQNWNDELPHYDYHHSYTQNWVCGPNWYNPYAGSVPSESTEGGGGGLFRSVWSKRINWIVVYLWLATQFGWHVQFWVENSWNDQYAPRIASESTEEGVGV